MKIRYISFCFCARFQKNELCVCQEPNNHPAKILTAFPQYSGISKIMLAHIIVLYSFQSGVVNPDNKIGIKAAWTAVTLTNQGRY